MRNLLLLGVCVLVIVAAIAACSPQSSVVEVTRVVSETITEQVEVTRIVEEAVEVEVTRLVETAAEETTEETSETETAADVPQEMTIVLVAEPPHLDWSDTGPGLKVNDRVAMNSYEALTGRDANGELIGVLAESWERVGETGWRFFLREGVTFHNGVPFNAENVKWNVDTKQNEEIVSLPFNIAGQAVTAEIVDEYTIDISTPVFEATLPALMSQVVMGEPGAVEADPDRRNMVGTGAYMLEEWVPGERIVLVANPDYWGGAPTIERATFVWREDEAVRSAMLQAAEADVIDGLSAQVAGTVPTLSAEIAEISFLYFDPNPPLDDLRVRQAICMAIDRNVLADQIMGGFAVPANSLATPNTCGYNPDIPVLPYDPEAARALIEEARADGVPVDNEITLFGRIGIYPNATETMEATQLWMNDIGLNATLQMMDVAVWREINLDIPVPEDRVGITQSSTTLNTGDGFNAIAGYMAAFRPTDGWYPCPGYEEFGGGRRPCIEPDIMGMTIEATALTEDAGRCEALADVYQFHHDNILWACPQVSLQSIWGVAEHVNWQPRPDDLILLKDITLN